MKRLALSLVAAGLVLANCQQLVAATLDDVRRRGVLHCGISTGLPGFSAPDDAGGWSGFDVEICRSIAAATLGDGSKVKFVPLVAKERFIALQTGEVDVLARSSAWTLTYDTSLGLHFTGVSYYDGQGFMVRNDPGELAAAELQDSTICVQTGSTAEQNLADYFSEQGLRYRPVLFDTGEQAVRGFETERCDVLTGDLSQLYGLRLRLKQPQSGVVLPEVISKEPLGPVVRQGDDAWFNIVRWTLFALLNAEELGITSSNVRLMKVSQNPAIRRFLGLEGINGEGLGLKADWAYQIIRQVGNYGEIFSRTVGDESELGIERGQNELWSNGGLQYAPPFR